MGILKYYERVNEMFELDKYPTPPISKNGKYQDVDWDTRDK